VYKFLQDNNVYHREAAVHGNYNFGQDAVDYIEDWLTDRIKFLDRYFIDRTGIITKYSIIKVRLFFQVQLVVIIL